MKIISDFKDYYDYIAGVYGMDDTIVYQRHHQIMMRQDYDFLQKEYKKKTWKKQPIRKLKTYDGEPLTGLIALCNTIYFVAIHQGKPYFGQDAAPLLKKNIQMEEEMNYHLKPTDLNDALRCPILLMNIRNNKPQAIAKNIRLSEYSFGTFMSALAIFTSISEFLTKEVEVIDDRTDVQKIQAAGFDNRTSFRKM